MSTTQATVPPVDGSRGGLPGQTNTSNSNGGKRSVHWGDMDGYELVFIREFEVSDDEDDEEYRAEKKGCCCVS